MTFLKPCEDVAYSIHGHMFYILQANSKRSIREEGKEIAR